MTIQLECGPGANILTVNYVLLPHAPLGLRPAFPYVMFVLLYQEEIETASFCLGAAVFL